MLYFSIFSQKKNIILDTFSTYGNFKIPREHSFTSSELQKFVIH